jgi:hypothetical protein
MKNCNKFNFICWFKPVFFLGFFKKIKKNQKKNRSNEGKNKNEKRSKVDTFKTLKSEITLKKLSSFNKRFLIKNRKIEKVEIFDFFQKT